ncbi:MAG: nitroreductase family protein [Nitrospirota bacterium]
MKKSGLLRESNNGKFYVMLTTKEAIEKRRSIRKFKPDPVPEECIRELLDAARLAPSGCNAQPWRFKVVKDSETKMRLADAAHRQSFVAKAPVVLICCADIKSYLDGTVSCIQDLGRTGAVEDRIVRIITERTDRMKRMRVTEIAPRIAFNVAIAIEHIVLRALDFGLGTCWVRLLDEQMIRAMFRWDENIHVVALLPIGFPAESPPPRKRLKINDILIE